MRVALQETVQKLPEHLWQSLTWDLGKEMAQHAQSTVDAGIQIYFCDPKSPRQKARTRTPTDFYANTPQRHRHGIPDPKPGLDKTAHSLNGRRRQTLGWMTPPEKPAELLQ